MRSSLILLLAAGVMLSGIGMGAGCVAAPAWTEIPVAADSDDYAGFLGVPDDSRFGASYRCGDAACGGVPVGCVLRTFPRKPDQWADDDVEELVLFMSEGGLRFLGIGADVRRAYGAIGDASVEVASIVFTSAATPVLVRLGKIKAAELPGRAEVRGHGLPVHVVQWVQDHAPQRAVCVGGDDAAAPSALEGSALGFAVFMSGKVSQ